MRSLRDQVSVVAGCATNKTGSYFGLRCYLPSFSRLDWLQRNNGYGFLILPMPVVSADADFAEQVQAATQAAGPVWLADTDLQHCCGLFRAEDGYFLH